jgi:hypothetical protein
MADKAVNKVKQRALVEILSGNIENIVYCSFTVIITFMLYIPAIFDTYSF